MAERRPEPPRLPRRFYETAEAGAAGEGHGVLLDGRPARTPQGNPLTVPRADLAADLAGEWAAQDEHIDINTMPLTRIANTAIDRVDVARDAVAREIAAYAGSDLVCYRAESPSGLVERQAEHWDPVVRWAEEMTGTRLVLAAGVIAVEQDPDMLAAAEARIAAHDDLGLAALAIATTVTGSALIALALSDAALDADTAWAAAHVDEDWQISQWGEDAEAARVRAARHRDFMAAARILDLCRA